MLLPRLFTAGEVTYSELLKVSKTKKKKKSSKLILLLRSNALLVLFFSFRSAVLHDLRMKMGFVNTFSCASLECYTVIAHSLLFFRFSFLFCTSTVLQLLRLLGHSLIYRRNYQNYLLFSLYFFTYLFHP